jgi:hypothetical protein
MPSSPRILKQILKNNPNIDRSYAEKLSVVIEEKSKKYKVPPRIFTAILMQESAYRLRATNKTCGLRNLASAGESCVITDIGISQIHYLNVKRFNLDKQRLTTDLEYSVDSGAMILAQYSRYQKREPKTWYSRYNCGTRKFSKIQDLCLVYKTRVDKYL